MTPRTDSIAKDLISRLEPIVRGEAVDVYHGYAKSQKARERLAEWDEQRRGDIELEALRRTLLPGLLIVEDKFTCIPRQWPSVFRRSLSTLEVERVVEFRGPGLPQLRPRGAPTTRDNAPRERYVYNAEPHDIALQTPFKNVDEDNIVSMFAPMMLGMAESFVQAEEIVHANVLNTGHVYNYLVMGDGCPLFAEHHPIDDGTYSNCIKLDLNEAALERVSAMVKRLPTQTPDVRCRARARLLAVPIELEFAAERLIKSLGSTTFYPEGYCVLDFLINPTAWFVATTIHGLVSYEKQPFKLDLKIEGNTLALEGSQSYCAGYTNPRGIIGSFIE